MAVTEDMPVQGYGLGGMTVTREVSLSPFTLARTVVVPVSTPMTMPSRTVAISIASLTQVTMASMMAYPFASAATAVSVSSDSCSSVGSLVSPAPMPGAGVPESRRYPLCGPQCRELE